VSEPDDLLCVPPGSQLRADAPLGHLKLAVARALEARMTTPGQWQELALVVDAGWILNGRLLDAQAHRDGDYRQLIHELVPTVLGLRYEEDSWGNRSGPFVDRLAELEEHLDLPSWLAEHAPRLHRLLYARDPAEAIAVEDVTEMAAAQALSEISRQLQRLHRDLGDDLSAAVGHAKELVESACKHVLGQTGPGAGGKLPQLVDAALRAVDRHPSQVDPGDPDAQLLKHLLGGTARQLEAIAGLRNRVGTGHGRAGDVVLDPALARLAIGQALTAVTYLLRVHDEASTTPAAEVATATAGASS
jgi:hypothetical protein